MMETLSIYLKETGIINYFDVLITPECTERHKPDPQPAIEALSRLNGVPERALFIGDSSFDVDCGGGAGMATAFVAWSHNAAETFNRKPTWIISDMLDLCVW